MKKILIGAVAALALTSCATILNGSRANVTIMCPDAERANLTVDDIYYRDVQFPITVSVKRGFSPSVIRVSDGERIGSTYVNKTFNETTLWNILLGGIPGFAIDAATGSITKPEMDSYIIYLDHTYPDVTVPYRPQDPLL